MKFIQVLANKIEHFINFSLKHNLKILMILIYLIYENVNFKRL